MGIDQPRDFHAFLIRPGPDLYFELGPWNNVALNKQKRLIWIRFHVSKCEIWIRLFIKTSICINFIKINLSKWRNCLSSLSKSYDEIMIYELTEHIVLSFH